MIEINWNFIKRPWWVFTLIGGVVMVVGLITLAVAVNQMVQEQKYMAGQCTISAKQLRHELSTTTTTHSSGNSTYTTTTTTDVYAPYFEYTVRTTDGRSYATEGYDGSDTYTSDQAGQQAIVDGYAVGQSYQCWYNAAKPTQAVLVRQPNWLAIVLGGAFALFGLFFAIIGLVLMRLFRRSEGFQSGEEAYYTPDQEDLYETPDEEEPDEEEAYETPNEEVPYYTPDNKIY